MGKLPVTKTKKDGVQAGTKVMKEQSVNRNDSRLRCHRKRISMLRRRISALLDEKESWEAKNRDIIDNFNNEKKLNAELKKDVFYWQRMYHESVLSQNAFKVKQTESISACLKDIKSAFPHLVGLSDTICRTQLRLTNMLSSSNSENALPRAFGEDRQANNDLSKKNEKRMKQVGPMVKGVLIQKPTIRLERVMLQQPQDQEPANNDLEPERGNALTPIVEENEQDTDSHLEQISMRRRRKHRLGTGERWRMRKQQEQLEKEREKERKREKENQRDSVTESSDSEDQMPVIRLQRVSGLLLSPKLLEVDRGRSSEGKVAVGRTSDPDNRSARLRASDDPKEGCSWMHISPALSNKKKQEKRKQETSSSSESSNEESEQEHTLAENKKLRTSLSDSLYNNSFSMKRKTSSSSSTLNTSRDTSESSKVEPDSTNNIEDVVFIGTSSASDSLGVNNSLSNSSLVATTRLSQDKLGSFKSCRTSQATPQAPDESSRSKSQRQSGSVCYSSTPITSPNVEGKRIRKPKIHLYPGEDVATAAVASKPKKSKTTETISSRSTVVKSQPSVTIRKLKKSSIINTTLDKSRSSIDQRLSQGETEGRNSRRIKSSVSYKEPPGNKKMRRP